ncbi:glycoside hydrolase family 88 protein [Pedosphaera parvula]|uniref:Glycosyl hydrolase family 88 n=1 Tax=Pedosphaera parvula (strain Ellin514) TaxID=320771 RepID=B9XB65_PEDPL|nr:glycoside hydrolase family 88 protein [Pedosphaera parvula]EEF62750.1 glycosyl hydrolase family 88 [Pedosphaera parvula Ellin514]
MLNIDSSLTTKKLLPAVQNVFELSAKKISLLEKRWRSGSGAPVFTVKGKYTARGWTEWTQGFQFGSAILQFDATGDKAFLEQGRNATVEQMASHISHVGVHDHGFNNVSTYGNLLRLMLEGRTPANEWERNFYELALKLSGAIQAARWTQISPELGYVYSFNGPHSLFSDTIRSMRALALGHQFGHSLMGERDQPISLLRRLLQHCEATARFNVYFGAGRDAYDVSGRVVHESVFNLNDGSYRCPSTQQGYSPFSTWTRGQAWVLCGYPEQLEFLQHRSDKEFNEFGGKAKVIQRFEQVATAVADFWLTQTPTDGIPYWDTGAPGLSHLKDHLNKPADPYNSYEPVDSSAAAIAAQGLIRLGNYLRSKGDKKTGNRYYQAGLTIAQHLFTEPYLSKDARHEGLLLHSVYHRPNGWDYVPPGAKVPCGESSMWGDYHARELALMLLRDATHQPYYTFFKV